VRAHGIEYVPSHEAVGALYLVVTAPDAPFTSVTEPVAGKASAAEAPTKGVRVNAVPLNPVPTVNVDDPSEHFTL
jgi:hypothetical protein